MRKQLISAGIALCLLFCSCSANQSKDLPKTQRTEDNTPETETVYTLKNITLPDADEALGDLYPEGSEKYTLLETLAAGNLYRMTEIYPEAGNNRLVRYYIQVLSSPYTEWTTFPLELSSLPGAAAESGETINYLIENPYVDSYGTVHFFLCGDSGNYLGKWSQVEGFSTRELSAGVPVTELFSGHMFSQWYENNSENLFLSNEEMFLKYNSVFEEQSSAMKKAEGLILQIMENPFSGTLYFIGIDNSFLSVQGGTFTVQNGGFSIWEETHEKAVFDTRNATDKGGGSNCFISGDNSCITFSSPADGYLCNQMGIYQFSMEEQSYTEIYNFYDAGMTQETSAPVRQMSISVKEDGTPLILCHYIDNSTWFAELTVEKSSETTKRQLELATVSADSWLKKAVVDFNRQNDEYEIILRTCPVNETPDDFRTRIQAELNSGKGPDILNTSVVKLRSGAEMGYLLDLTEFFRSYEDVFFSSATQLGKTGEQYYGIPYAFNVITLAANQEVIGDRDGWTLEEAMQCMEQSDAETIIRQLDMAYSYYWLGIAPEYTELIDWKNRISHLNEKEGCDLLDFVARYSHDDTRQGTMEESLTEIVYTMDPAAVQYTSDLFQGNEIYIGFPNKDRSSGHRLTGSILEVNRNCTAVDGAIQFIEYLLSDGQQAYLAEIMLNGRPGSGYPVRYETLEQLFDDLHKKAENATPDDILSLSSEQYDSVWDVLRSAEIYDNETEIILDILIEETGTFRSGSKTARQVMDIIHNRVQLYLSE